MNIIYWIGWSFFKITYAVYLRYRAFNPERVPRSGSVILASNHASILDPPLVGIGLKRVTTFLARDTLFKGPVGWLFRHWHAIPIDRDGGGPAGMRRIMAALAEGRAVLLFPEGTRTRDGQLQPARSGIGLLVIKSEAPVVPVRVWGTMQAMGRGVHFPRPKRVMVKYGEPMDFKELRAEAKNCSKERLKEIYQQVAEGIMAAIGRLEPKRDS
jgi:1-acyl-sn-glycerol-3-phosphate acyltransferase